MLGAGLLAALVVFFALWLDEGEVVTLHTYDASGQEFETQLWIAEMAGDLYLRGTPDRRWVARLQTRPDVRLERGGETSAHRALRVDDPAIAAAVDAAMAEKYGLADRIAAALFDRRLAVAIRLEPTANGGHVSAGPPHS